MARDPSLGYGYVTRDTKMPVRFLSESIMLRLTEVSSKKRGDKL